MVKRRKAWNGDPPRTEAEARRTLLRVARECIERFGLSKVGLSDVAIAAGVTRQTVYRYFENADELFTSAAVLASGGFLERVRKRVLLREGLAERIVETLVVAIHEVPKDVHLSALVEAGNPLEITSALQLAYAQEEMVELGKGDRDLSPRDRDELAEILLRLLKSFLDDPGPERTEEELRAYLCRWLVPVIEAKR
ncbi:MAG: AcrR family transcriptional regulator [Myxococcota bacterium]|jgi:AcrR family transcriptional regulator